MKRWFSCAWLSAVALASSPAQVHAQDLSAIVARASEQMDAGNFADGMRTLAGLRGKTLPPQLAIEVALLETTGSLVTSTPEAARDACSRAIVAAGYDPEVARERSPKVREACKLAAKKVRGERLTEGKVEPGKLEVERPEVAHRAVRLSTKVEKTPPWLRMIARVQSSALEGTFDVPLVPSDDGALLGTLDSAWTRPRSKLTIKLVAQDRFGDLGDPLQSEELTIPPYEAAISLGSIPSGGRVEVDGERVTPDDAGRVPASSGKHEVKLTLPSGAFAETEVELERGAIAQVTLAPSEQGPSRVAPWIATGTSLALGVAGAVLLVNAELRRSDLEEAAAEREPGTSLPLREYSELESIDSERRTFLYAGLGVLGGAGAAGILATILWLVPSGGGGEPPAETAVLPVISPSFIGVVWQF